MAPMRSPADARTRLDFWQAASGALQIGRAHV